MEYTIQQLARLSGVTRRTLRYYDQIGLLRPARTTSAGYRIYGPAEVDRLQQILFYRALGLELSAVRNALDNPDFQRQTALEQHLAELEARRDALDSLILTVRKTLDAERGGTFMSDAEKFACFKQNVIQKNEETYGAEVRQKYGPAALEEANVQFMGRSQSEYDQWTALGTELQAKLEAAVQARTDPTGPEGHTLAQMHRNWCVFTWAGASNPQLHRSLATLYTEDTRFTAYYDHTVPGCAAFLRAAIESLCEQELSSNP